MVGGVGVWNVLKYLKRGGTDCLGCGMGHRTGLYRYEKRQCLSMLQKCLVC